MKLTLADWTAVSLEAFDEVASSMLLSPGMLAGRRCAAMPSDQAGAFIPLVSELGGAQVGLIGAEPDRKRVSGAMLQLDVAEADGLTTIEVADAMGELVNVAAGGIKRRLLERAYPTTLGLPVFLNGQIAATDRVEVQVTDVQIGGMALSIVIARAREVSR